MLIADVSNEARHPALAIGGVTAAGYLGMVIGPALVGILSGLFFRYGVNIVLLTILALILVNLVAKGGRETLRLSLMSLADGAKNSLPVGIACALVGVMIGTD